MEAILFFRPFSGSEGTDTVVIYTMGLRKWIYLLERDAAFALVGGEQCCNDNWLLQQCSVLSETDIPPVSPFCIKERYTGVCVLMDKGGFTLQHPSLGHLQFSALPLQLELPVEARLWISQKQQFQRQQAQQQEKMMKGMGQGRTR